MTKEAGMKYIFCILSVLLLIFLIGASRNAGVTCDEVLHYNHSVSVYNYFASHGKDVSALNTPETNLKYYGQSYDNVVTILIKWFEIEDIYKFRHFMSAIAGWLTIVVSGLFAVWLSGFRTGIIVLILFAVSPTFIGHSYNNLKDIPFALAYISSIFFSLKFIFAEGKRIWLYATLLVLFIAAAISIRAGGLLLICYLFFFYFFFYFLRYLKNERTEFKSVISGFLLISAISIIAFFFSILLWPYALQHPVKNVLESYKVMAHFPATFRQIFEGRVEWSDHMPWYYLIKSMVITIPVVITAGLIIFTAFSVKICRSESFKKIVILLFTILFPVIFVIIEDSNLYSSWRQFLFIYPGIIIVSALGFTYLLQSATGRFLQWLIICSIILLSIHPFKFMMSDTRYAYLYYNQIAGGLKGAYGNYETDYYYVSQTEASDWLLNYLRQNRDTNNIKVCATYSVQWAFRDYPSVKTSYSRFEERSLSDWDYAIIANRYISPFKLKNGLWPPENTIHTVYADSVPLCAVVKRKTRSDFLGYEALKYGEIKKSICFFENAMKENKEDEMIFFNFATALIKDNQEEKANSVLEEGLKLNPDFEMILMYLGNLAKAKKNNAKAMEYYERLISVNRKYFEAYTELSELYATENIFKARELLRSCLRINPRYKPAIIALADTYRISDPEVAGKYDELAKRIE